MALHACGCCQVSPGRCRDPPRGAPTSAQRIACALHTWISAPGGHTGARGQSKAHPFHGSSPWTAWPSPARRARVPRTGTRLVCIRDGRCIEIRAMAWFGRRRQIPFFRSRAASKQMLVRRSLTLGLACCVGRMPPHTSSRHPPQPPAAGHQSRRRISVSLAMLLNHRMGADGP